MHTPVLLEDILNFLKENNNVRNILDCTFGLGGHSNAIRNLGLNVVCIDIDKKYYQLAVDNNFESYNINFANAYKIYKLQNRFDFILLDLGINYAQIINDCKGLSFKINSFLDMRLNRDNSNCTAYEILNSFKIDKILDIFKSFSNDRFSEKIVSLISERRKNKELIRTTFELVDIIKKAKGKHFIKSGADQIFQALRIYVNNEMENLKNFLKNFSILLNMKKGYICTISFHSIEDRVIKNFFKNEKFELIAKKKPNWLNIKKNKFCRSSLLRIYKI